MEYLYMVFSFLAAIIILVTVHEFGHYYVARLCGVKVLRFCIGLGRPLLSFRDKHGTEFGITAIPLGGYVKMLGEQDENVAAEELHMSFGRKSVAQRVAILAAGPAANFIFACIIFWGVFFFTGTIGVSPLLGGVDFGSIADRAGLKQGQEIVAVDGVSTSTRMEVVEQLFMRLGETGQIDLTVIEPDSDLKYDVVVPLNKWMSGAEEPDPVSGLGLQFYRPGIVLGEILEDSAAASSGLQVKDQIIAYDGHLVDSRAAFIKSIQASPGTEIELNIVRDGVEKVISVTPAPQTDESGAIIGKIGAGIGYIPWPKEMIRTQKFGVFEAFGKGVEETAGHVKFIMVSLKKLLVREISTKNLSGPIGIAKVAGDHAQAGLPYFIKFLAILSVYLGVMNLLPIPVLDGGHIVFCLVEAVKGSPLSEKLQMLSVSFGLAILGCLMIVAFYNDLLRL